jgi:60 kDa SS-A/Ro ribonucleoprotein
MTDALSRFLQRDIPQTEAASELQVANSAGGFSFAVTPEIRLERFLILGTDGGTYYIKENDLTKQNLSNLKMLTETDPKFVVDLAVEISRDGRAYKNGPAIFVMAYVMTFGNDEAKSYARGYVNEVVRTSTHLFTFNKYLKLLATGTGLGTSRNRAIASWYESKSTDQIAYQAVKYRQREGWTHRDALRQSRPKNIDPSLAKWILGKTEKFSETPNNELPAIVYGFENAQASTNVKELLDVLDRFKSLPWEAIPTGFLKNADVWKKLFYNGQLNGQALVRNITRLARLDAFNDLVFAGDYAQKLSNEEMIRKTMLHPINFLNALVVHTEGQASRSGHSSYAVSGQREKDWPQSSVIVDALNAGFHTAFKTIVPTKKRTMIAVDVSGSMSSSMSLGLDLSAAQVSGAMAATIARTEPYYMIMGFANEFRDLGITAKMNLGEIMRRVQVQNFGQTDCGLPVTYAQTNKLEIDTFIIITDNETYAGRVHPHVALQRYRQKTGIAARMVVVSVTGNEFTIADPTDAGMLDVVGSDSNLPKLIAEFSKGKI